MTPEQRQARRLHAEIIFHGKFLAAAKKAKFETALPDMQFPDDAFGCEWLMWYKAAVVRHGQDVRACMQDAMEYQGELQDEDLRHMTDEDPLLTLLANRADNDPSAAAALQLLYSSGRAFDFDDMESDDFVCRPPGDVHSSLGAAYPWRSATAGTRAAAAGMMMVIRLI